MVSARSIPPSIASRRARNTCSNRGATNLAMTSSKIPKAMIPIMISPNGGISGFSFAARMIICGFPVWSGGSVPVRYGSGAEDEGDDEADQRQRLGEREAEEGVGPG